MQHVAPAHIRSFKPRRGRVTPGQQRALDALADTYVLPWSPHPLDLADAYGRSAPLVLEIGFGMGEATALMAAADPERDLLAVDAHTPGTGALLRRLEQESLTHVRVAEGDAVGLLRDMLAPGSLDEVRVFFPDPWPKARHAKRRLVSAPFAALVAERLRPGGRLHVATDWPAYAAQVLAVLGASPAFEVVSRDRGSRPVTRFEGQGLAAGRPPHDVVAVRLPR